MCNEIIDTTETIPAKLVPTTINSKNIYISLSFLLVVIALLIAVSTYCCLIKYGAKEKHLLPHTSQLIK